MNEFFVAVSGLPASGKSTLARQLAPALKFPLLDKDVILERLFEQKGLGDAAWRRALSRESDLILQREAEILPGAILVSHWRLPGSPENSGTPTAWLAKLPHPVVNVHCECPVEVSAERFANRSRHPGHRDRDRSPAEILASIRAIASLQPIEIGPRICVDTSRAPDLQAVLHEIHRVLAGP